MPGGVGGKAAVEDGGVVGQGLEHGTVNSFFLTLSSITAILDEVKYQIQKNRSKVNFAPTKWR